MKLFSILLLVSIAFGNLVFGQLLFTETFNYTEGALVLCGTNQPNPSSPYYPLAANDVSGGVWTNGSSSSFDDPLLVQSGALTYSGYSLSGQGNKLFCPNLTANTSNNRGYSEFEGQQTVYYSLMVNLRETTNLSDYPSAKGEYLTGLWSTGNATNANYRGILCFQKGSVAGKYQMGIRVNQPNAVAVWANLDLDTLTTYLVVVKYERDNPTCKASLWINPSLAGTEPTPDAFQDLGTADPVSGNIDVARFGIYQRGDKPKIDLGGIKVGLRWEDITNIASLPLTEIFDYDEGALVLCGANQPNPTSPYYPLTANNVSNSIWTNGSSSAFDDPMLVQSGALIYSGYSLSGLGKKLFCPNLASNTSNNRGYRAFESQQTVYYTLMVNLRETTNLSGFPATKGEYLAGLWATGNATNANFRGLLMFQSGSVANTYRMGVLVNQPGTTTSWVNVDLNPLTTYLVVIKYERNNPNCKASIWINPVVSGNEPAPDAISDLGTTDPVAGNLDIGRFGIYQRGDKPKVDIGGISVASNWGEIFVPVELVSFTATSVSNSVYLNWSTASELNNSGFEVQRANALTGDWTVIAFVPGNGTTTETKRYEFVDVNLPTGKYLYRIKQLDFDGTFKFYGSVEINHVIANQFYLSDAYPNPFNPNTKINFSVSENSFTTLKVYNSIGQLVKTIFSGMAEVGKNYVIDFSAENLTSGIYFTILESANNSISKKIVLLK